MTNKPLIQVLYRSTTPNAWREDEELRDLQTVTQKFAPNVQVIQSWMDILPGALVIGRYAALPYYRELELDAHKVGATLVNTTAEHEYVADIGQWACVDGLFASVTPKTCRAGELRAAIRDEGMFYLLAQ